jgi:hypothetical protein
MCLEASLEVDFRRRGDKVDLFYQVIMETGCNRV